MIAVETPFWSLVDASGDCWLWTGSTNRDGYGIMSDRSRHTLAHRKAYELLIGSVPADTNLDHLCRNRACVNPDHLEPVAHRVNILRADEAMGDRYPETFPLDLTNTGWPCFAEAIAREYAALAADREGAG